MSARLKFKYLLCCLILLPLLLLSLPIDRQFLATSCGRIQGAPRYFIAFRGSCYHIPKRSMTWFTGLRHCLVNGFTLATLDEHEQILVITRHCQRNNMRQEYWFGATDFGSMNTFWYISNGFQVQYGPNEALGTASSQHCLKLNVHANSTSIARDSCYAVHPVICERVKSGGIFRNYNKFM